LLNERGSGSNRMTVLPKAESHFRIYHSENTGVVIGLSQAENAGGPALTIVD